MRCPLLVHFLFTSTLNFMFDVFLWLELKPRKKSEIFLEQVACLWQIPRDVSRFLDEFKDLEHFCFPDLESQCIHRSSLLQKEYYVFLLTDSEGNKRYGICLRSFCKGEGKRYDVRRRPKCCLCIVTRYPYFTLFQNLLLQVHSMCLLDHDLISARELLVQFYKRGFPNGNVVEMSRISKCRKNQRLQFVIPKKNCLDIPILPLLEVLGVNNFLLLLSCILCEKRLLFISENVSVLSARVLAAVSILHPFQWQVSSVFNNFSVIITSTTLYSMHLYVVNIHVYSNNIKSNSNSTF